MKKYIILTGTIARMGGAQMYVSNKAKYVKKKDGRSSSFQGTEDQFLLIIYKNMREILFRIWMKHHSFIREKIE